MAGVCSKSGPASAANAGGFLQTSLSAVTRQSGFCAALQHPVRRVTPDRVLALVRIHHVRDKQIRGLEICLSNNFAVGIDNC
jgi:hypothetical protein